MFNLVKMEMYRLLRTPSLYVFLAFMILMAYISVDSTNADLKEIRQKVTDAQGTDVTLLQTGSEEKEEDDNDENDVDIGISVVAPASWVDKVPLPELQDNDYSSGILMLFVAIFIPLFVVGEQKSGYIKNIGGQLAYRGQLALSKLVPVAFEILLAFTVFTSATIIFSKIYMDKYFVMGKLSELLAVSGYHFLTHVAFGMFLTLIVLMLRGKSGAIVLGILLSMDIFASLYAKLDGWLDFKVSEYLLSTNMKTIVLDAGNKIVRQGIIVATVFLVVSLALSVLVLQKRDIC